MKISGIVCAVILGVFVGLNINCSKAKALTPREVYTEYLNALKAKNYTKAWDYMSNSMREEYEIALNSIKQASGKIIGKPKDTETMENDYNANFHLTPKEVQTLDAKGYFVKFMEQFGDKNIEEFGKYKFWKERVEKKFAILAFKHKDSGSRVKKVNMILDDDGNWKIESISN